MRAVCEISGGYDSAAAALVAFERGYEVVGAFFDYGNKYSAHERRAADVVAGVLAKRYGERFLGLRTQTVPLELGFALGVTGTPIECVPYRNLVFAALNANLAASVGAEVVFNGSKTNERRADDPYSFADSCAAFFRAVNDVVSTATEPGMQHPRFDQALLLDGEPLTKAEVLKKLHLAGFPLHLLWNCYHPEGGQPCRVCYHCELTAKAIRTAELDTVLEYAAHWGL